MPFDEKLADRIRSALHEQPHVTERRMFGGIVFMVNGHMCVGVIENNVMVRVGSAAFDKAVALPHARPMDFTGRQSTGMVYVAPAGVKTAAALRAWIARGLSFVNSLPTRV